MAEAVFQHIVKMNKAEDKFEIDSAGTNPFIDANPYHPLSIKVCENNSIKLEGMSRTVIAKDLKHFDYIFVMDDSNFAELVSLAMDNGMSGQKKVFYLLDYHEPAMRSRTIPDPYFGTQSDFERVFALIKNSCENLYNFLTEKKKC